MLAALKNWECEKKARVVPGTRDPLGMMEFLRTVDWTATRQVSSPVYDGHKLYNVRAKLASASAEELNDHQLLGMRLYNQSCRVCHTKPQLTSGTQYGPVLSRVSLNGNDDALRAFIGNGSAKMPGFRYHFKPAEIDAIVSYLKTVPPPAD